MIQKPRRKLTRAAFPNNEPSREEELRPLDDDEVYNCQKLIVIPRGKFMSAVRKLLGYKD